MRQLPVSVSVILPGDSSTSGWSTIVAVSTSMPTSACSEGVRLTSVPDILDAGLVAGLSCWTSAFPMRSHPLANTIGADRRINLKVFTEAPFQPQARDQ